jgi:hypothetical protein
MKTGSVAEVAGGFEFFFFFCWVDFEIYKKGLA